MRVMIGCPCRRGKNSGDPFSTSDACSVAPQVSMVAPQTSMVALQTSIVAPQTSIVAPHTSIVAPQTSSVSPQTSIVAPQTSIVAPQTVIVILSDSCCSTLVGYFSTSDGYCSITVGCVVAPEIVIVAISWPLKHHSGRLL